MAFVPETIQREELLAGCREGSVARQGHRGYSELHNGSDAETRPNDKAQLCNCEAALDPVAVDSDSSLITTSIPCA